MVVDLGFEPIDLALGHHALGDEDAGQALLVGVVVAGVRLGKLEASLDVACGCQAFVDDHATDRGIQTR